MKKLNFITQFKIEYLVPFTGCRKVLGKNVCKYIQLMLVFLKAPSLVLYFSYSLTFLMILFVMLLSMLMILLTIVMVASVRVGFWT